ncbi:flagellar export protein FliJ [Spirochaetota bacterium]
MKKFEFKLEKLLDMRLAKEREVQNELAALLALQNREKVKQEELKRSILDHQKKFQKKLRLGDYSVNENLIYEKYVDISLRAIDVSEEKIQGMEPGIKKVRKRLVEASKERRVVEKLKERKLEEYNFKLNREIAKENDDMNINLFNRTIHRVEEKLIG